MLISMLFKSLCSTYLLSAVLRFSWGGMVHMHLLTADRELKTDQE